jgi:Flp pilus assembly protein TadD
VMRQYLDWNMAGAESSLREAIRLNPGDAEAHHELSMLLSRLKKLDEALEESRKAIAFAPTVARFINGIGEVLVFSDDSVKHAEALAIANRLLSMDSTNSAARGLRAFAYEQMGRWDDATTAWAACVRPAAGGCGVDGLARIGYLQGLRGRESQAMQILDTLKARVDERDRSGTQGDLAVGVATVYMGLGKREETLTWLERAAELRAGWMLYLAIDPTFKPLHGEPRFQALLRRIGLPTSTARVSGGSQLTVAFRGSKECCVFGSSREHLTLGTAVAIVLNGVVPFLTPCLPACSGTDAGNFRRRRPRLMYPYQCGKELPVARGL